MNKKLCLVALVLGIFATGVAFFSVNTQNAGASVGMEYSYKNITSTNASSTASVSIKSGFGTLGSVIVASSSAAVIRVYDGTATSTGTLIASFPASATVGTYTFDVAVAKGVVLDVPSNHNGNYTVTFR
jgi:hypothetical protein